MTLRHHNRNKALCTWYFVKGFSTTVACTETLSATASQTMSMGSYKSIFLGFVRVFPTTGGSPFRNVYLPWVCPEAEFHLLSG